MWQSAVHYVESKIGIRGCGTIFGLFAKNAILHLILQFTLDWIESIRQFVLRIYLNKALMHL